MWEDNNFQFDDYSFLNSPEFQQQVLDAIAQSEQPSLLPTEVVPSPQSGGVDVAALKALGLSDQEVSQIANFDPSQLNMDRLGTVGGLGIGGGVYNGEYKVFDAPLSNKGNPTSQMGDNKIYIAPESQVRLVNQATGETITQGVGYDAAQEAIDKAKSLTSSGGNKANWQIQVAAPGEGTFSIAANEKENKNVIGKIADVALPVLASALVPGGGLLGTILPAAGGSAVSSVAQGRDLGDTLLRAAIAGGGAGLGEGIFGAGVPTGGEGATVGANLPSFGALAAPYAAEAAGSVVGSAAGSAAGNLIDEIIVTAAKSAAPSGLFPAVTGGIANTLLDRAINQPVEVQQPTQIQPISEPVAYTLPPENLIVTAQQPDVSALFPAVTSGISNTLPDQVVNEPAQAAQTQQATQQEYTPPPEEIVVKAPENILPDVLTVPAVATAAAAANAAGATTPQSADTTKGMTPEEIEGITMAGAAGGGASWLTNLLGKLGVTDLLTLASIAGGAIAGKGGGGTGTTAVPYVSPFGAGPAFGAGQDFRINPNIADYERYGFGPQASFFAPGYSQLVVPMGSAAAQTTPGPSSAMTNPKYEPLI